MYLCAAATPTVSQLIQLLQLSRLLIAQCYRCRLATSLQRCCRDQDPLHCRLMMIAPLTTAPSPAPTADTLDLKTQELRLKHAWV
jgi:hypothetical protein